MNWILNNFFNFFSFTDIINGLKSNHALSYLGIENAGELATLAHRSTLILTDPIQEIQKLYDTIQCILDDRVTPLEFHIEYPEVIRERNLHFRLEDNEINSGQDIVNTVFEPRRSYTDAKNLYDTPDVYHDTFIKDCEKNKLFQLFDCNQQKYSMVLNLFKSHYKIVRELFRFYSSANLNNPFTLNRKCFISSCRELGFFDDKYCNIKDLDHIFYLTVKDQQLPNSPIKTEKNNEKESTSQLLLNKEMRRHQFIESLIRIGIKKYIDSGECPDLNEAMKLLLRKHILSRGKYIDGNDFRCINKLHVYIYIIYFIFIECKSNYTIYLYWTTIKIYI